MQEKTILKIQARVLEFRNKNFKLYPKTSSGLKLPYNIMQYNKFKNLT